MALTNNGTAVYIADSYIPAGYTKPSITKFTNYEAKYPDYQVSVAKTAVENADKVVTFTALVAAVTAAVSAVITADFNVGGLTVTAFANLKEISHNFTLDGVQYTNGAINFSCKVDIFVKTAAL